MSTSKTYQQSLADAGSETRPPMLERGSYIPWASRFKRFLNRKRENRKFNNTKVARLIRGSSRRGLYCYYDAEMELMNMILLSIPNEIYNSVDSCKTAKEMWDRVERLMRGTIQNQVDKETRFTNEFDQFVAEPGESLVSVYNRFAQLMNDLERNNMKFPTVSVNTKFLNSLQPEWLKYVTQVRLAKKLTVDSFDDLSQFEKLVNTSRAKKLEKSHDPLALVAHTGSSSRNTSSYYVTHPSSVVDYDEEYEQDDVHNHSEDPLASAMLLLAKAITQNFSNPTNNRLRASSNTRNQAVVQGDRVNIQSKNSGNVGRNNRRAYVQEEVVEGRNATNETANVQRIVRTPTPGNISTGQCYNCGGKGHYARNYPKPRVRDSKYFMEQMLLAKQDEAGVILTDEQNDFLFADASRMEEIEELSANICLMARIQPADQNSDDEPSYESAFVSKVQSSSINENDEQMYPTHTKIINSTIDDDQINSNIQFDSVKGNVNSGSVEKDTHVYDRCALETLARNAYDEAAKQQRFAQKVQQQNMTLTSQIEMYKERNRVLENITKDNNYLKEFLEAMKGKNVFKKLMGNIEIPLNVRDSEETLEDAFKSQQKMNEKMNDPIAVANKQNCWTIDYKQLNALYNDFVPQKESFVEQTCSSSSYIPFVKILETKTMPSELPLINGLFNIKVRFEKLFLLINRINLFQRDIKEIKDAFEQNDVYLDEIERQNDLLKDQLLEASLKHDIELCVLLNHECVDKIQKLEDENVSLDFKVQSLIKERDNAKMEYKKLFDSIKKTRSQTQKEMDELIAHVSEKTYAYGAIRAENQNLLHTISELKARMKNGENGIEMLHLSVRDQRVGDSHVKTSCFDLSLRMKQRKKQFIENFVSVLVCKMIPKSSETTFVAPKTRFSEKATQSKTLDTTSVASKSKIDEASASKARDKVVQIVLWVVDSGCSKHMTGDRSLLRNFVEKFMGTVRFGNDNFAAITGYGDYIHGNITICHVYYVEGLGHNLFSVGQFCDGDLEVAFRSNTCYVRNLEGDDLLTGGRDSNLYTISISDMAASSPICLMSKATSTKSWLWHRRLSHLNFGTINDLTKLDLVDGMNATSSVKRPKSRDSHVKTSVLDVSKNEAKKEAVYVRKNKQTDNTFAKVVSNKENVIDVAVANASKAKTLLCVSCMQSVLIPCHDKCVAKHKLNVRSNARRTFSVNSRIPKSSETTFVAPKTRFSEKATQSKTLDTTSVASKSKIDEASASKARDKVSSAFKKKKRNMRDKPLSPFMLNKIRTSRLWQKWFESQPNVMWTPVNTKPHAHTNPSNTKPLVVQIVLWVVDSGCSKHMTGDRSLLRNFVEKFMGTVRFGNDNFAAITGYGDYIHGNITICHVYYVEGLGHNLFSVGQFCDGDLEVAFRSNTCYVRNLEGDDLLTGGRDLNLYTISISDMAASLPICLMSKATSTKSWLWHRRLSHLNFGTINDLTKLDLVDGLPKFKYGKDHLCSACERGKSKKASHPPKLIPSDYSKLELLHMDLCGLMRVASVNGKNYILVIVDDFSRFMLPEFLWAEAVATTCFTQNWSIINTRHNKTPYELLRGRKLNVEYFHVFGSLCYPTNDRDDLGKMKPKTDIRVFIGYSETSRGFRIYNCRTKKIMETIHVKFDELTAMASEHDCLEPDLQRFNNLNSSDDLMDTPSKEDLDNLFGPMFEDYFEQKSSDTTINSAAQPTHDQEDSPSTSSIIVDTHEAPPVVTTSDEQTSPISLQESDEVNQEDSADFDGNTQFVPYDSLNHEEIESSTTNLEPSNVQNFHQVQPSTHIWTKDHPLDQVIGDPSKPVMTRQRLHTDSEVCMYALTVSTFEPKNIKEVMADHSWIESMQDELNQFERLQVWESVTS
ncbi:retrovirus-related pol polyprotein from transposon TNT 1-94 [Tanacetum coccineum]|uniref:Retrovirus-related pol polyprotein from transposon TNT 1-94 n=1 Tax=Tanacetum coccineum TaxID=301880 RepID=A0ABQ4YSP2_9ASTR